MARSRSSTEARGRTAHTRPGRRRRSSLDSWRRRSSSVVPSGARRGPHKGNTEMQGSGGGATNLSAATTAASSSTSTPTVLAEAMQLSLVASGRVCGGVDDGSLPSSFATAASPPSVRHSSALWSRDGTFVLDCAPAPAGQARLYLSPQSLLCSLSFLGEHRSVVEDEVQLWPWQGRPQSPLSFSLPTSLVASICSVQNSGSEVVNREWTQLSDHTDEKSSKRSCPFQPFNERCIDCATCRWMVSEVFKRVDGMSAVTAQPSSDETRTKALQALLSCPMALIHTDRPAKDILQVQNMFPLAISLLFTSMATILRTHMAQHRIL